MASYQRNTEKTALRTDLYSELDSWLLRLIRQRGYVRKPTAAQLKDFENDGNARISWEMGNRSLARGGGSPQWQRIVYNWAIVENWVLHYHPGHSWTANLRQWEVGQGEFVDPLPVEILQGLLQATVRTKGEVVPGGTIPGLGCMFGSAKITAAVVTKVHKIFGLTSPCSDAVVVQQLKAWRLAYHASHHVGFDAYEDLPKLVDAALSVVGWTSLKRAQVAAMILYTFDHGHRPDSELGPYCLDVNDITAPMYLNGTDSHGQAKFLKVGYKWWKGRPDPEQGHIHEQQFHANPYDAKLCAVKHIIGWLALGGHAPIGPLFGNLEPARKGGQMLQAHHKEMKKMGNASFNVWHTKDGECVNYSSAQVAGMLKKVFERADELHPWDAQYPEQTDFSASVPHDFRVAFAMWVRSYRQADSTFE
ncbi:hypothetical protein M885DRAFT_544021 [Pelagophyceae sp. CCMP2097]|nr:hypothetical protein M885DRAFT_544021 [Pelagophyceae sp. CCMP2097]